MKTLLCALAMLVTGCSHEAETPRALELSACEGVCSLPSTITLRPNGGITLQKSMAYPLAVLCLDDSKTAQSGTIEWRYEAVNQRDAAPGESCDTPQGGNRACWIDPTNDNMLPHGYPDPCLSIMREAMQAMDPFVDWRFLFGLAHKDPIETTDQEKIDAFKKWDQAKAQCWTKK